eukprot:1713122-Pyramimonas_sp.AAC.1
MRYNSTFTHTHTHARTRTHMELQTWMTDDAKIRGNRGGAAGANGREMCTVEGGMRSRGGLEGV